MVTDREGTFRHPDLPSSWLIPWAPGTLSPPVCSMLTVAHRSNRWRRLGIFAVVMWPESPELRPRYQRSLSIASVVCSGLRANRRVPQVSLLRPGIRATNLD